MSVFIDDSKKSIYLQICVHSMCVCVCKRLFVHVCRSLWTRFFLVCKFARMCVCVSVCMPSANVVKAGGNLIGYDLCWQVLRAIVITPVWVNHISPCVQPHTLPTWWISSLNWIKLMWFHSPPKTGYQKWFMMYLRVSSIFHDTLF